MVRAMRCGVLMAGLTALLGTSCGISSQAATPGGRIEVVAAENFWGSIAAQLGGDRVEVTSIITSPNTDPHAYEATPHDARLIATAGLLIENGAGYDAWVSELASASPSAHRLVLDLGDLNGVPVGGNPHLWYSPAFVATAVDRITADLTQLDATGASYFEELRSAYQTAALKAYLETIATIHQKYRGTPIGASESMFAYLSPALGLDLITPPGFMKAISEGSDPSVADRAAADEQLKGRLVRVFVYNPQNSSPDVLSLVKRARANGIPVVQMTETLSPANLTFQEWQTNQLRSLLGALGG